MSRSVSTWVSAGTLSRSTPDPSSGVTPTTSTVGRLNGGVSKGCCAAAAADSRPVAKPSACRTRLRPAIFLAKAKAHLCPLEGRQPARRGRTTLAENSGDAEPSPGSLRSPPSPAVRERGCKTTAAELVSRTAGEGGPSVLALGG